MTPDSSHSKPAAPLVGEPSTPTATVMSAYVTDPGTDRRFWLFEPVLLWRIVRLGLPVIIGMLTQTAINLVDTIFVGRLPEKLAVAGTGALGPSLILLWLFGGFFSAISVGTQAFTARRFGEGDVEGAGRVLANAATIAFTTSLFAMALALGLVDKIFPYFNHDPAVQVVGIAYCKVRFLGIPAMVMMSSFKSFYDAIGQVRVHMTIAIVMNVINLVLNYGLVFGNLGMPDLDVVGSAWASVVASSSGFLMIFLWAMRQKDRKLYKAFRGVNLDRKVAWSVASMSLWSGIATLFVMLGFSLFFVIVGRVDKIENLAGVNTAATTVIINITMLIFMTCLAFGTSTATLVSQSLGAKKPELASRYGWQSVLVIIIVMACFGALMSLFPEQLMRVFLPADAAHNEALKDAVIHVGTRSLAFCGLLAPITAAALVLTQALYGAGESLFVMICEVVLHSTCLVPLAYFFAIYLDLGLIGCWYATGVYATGLLLATGIKFKGGSWQHRVI